MQTDVNKPAAKSPMLIYLVTEDWYFMSHRLPMARAARDAGYRVVVATRMRNHRAAIEAEGFEAVALSLQRGSLNPFTALRDLSQIIALYRKRRPDIVHHVAFKPTLYGSIAARFARVPAVVNAMTGLGYVFASNRPLARIARPVLRRLFRWLFSRPGTVVLMQNDDDIATFREAGIVSDPHIAKVRGSGVDLSRFEHIGVRSDPAPFVAAYVGRMIADKGVHTLAEAMAMLKERGVDLRLLLCGTGDPDNPGSIPDETLQRWNLEPNIEWRGHVSDIPGLWAEADIAVLGSRREGLPMSLLEAAAAGRPIVATDVPGCREICVPETNGILVPFANAKAFADALAALVVDQDMRVRFGTASRDLIRSDLSSEAVGGQIVGLYDSVRRQAAASP